MVGVKYIAAGFVQDAERLLTEFVKESSAEFRVFTHFWKKHNFAAVFLGRSTTELQQFTHEIFQLTLKFLVTADRYHRIGSVFLLYALFRNQIVEPPTRIRILQEQYQHFMELIDFAEKETLISLHYVITFLMDHGFDYVAHPTLVGPRNTKHSMEVEKKTLQMNCLLKDVKENALALYESNSLQELEDLSKTYAEMTKNIPFKNNVFQDADDFSIENHIKNLARLVDAEGTDDFETSKNKKEYDNIGDRRARIKSEAFSSKAWFRQLNPTEDDEDESDKKFTRSRAQRKSLRKSKLPKESQDEESDEKVEEKPKRRKRRMRIPKEKRRIGRPRKNQAIMDLVMEADDVSDENPLKGIKRKGPVARSSYLDDYVEEPFKPAEAEITILSSTSEEEIIDEDEDSDEVKKEIVDELDEEKVDEPDDDILEELVF